MRNLKRALSLGLTATMLSSMMVAGAGAASYADVSSKHNEEAIDVLKAVSVMTGDQNGNFNPAQNVTRAEMATIMANMLDLDVENFGISHIPFTDVPAWAAPYVAACYAAGVTAGTSATTYSPNASVTTTEAALMMLKALGYFQYVSDFNGDWALSTVKQASTAGLFDGIKAGSTDAMTRNEIAQLALNTLEGTMVQADKSGSDITVGDIVITGNVKYEDVISTDSMAGAFSDMPVESNTQKRTLELGEKLYNGDLKKQSTSDDMDRPAHQWLYDSKAVGTYTDSATATFTDEVSQKELYNAVGSQAFKNNWAWSLSVDGEGDRTLNGSNGNAPTISKNSNDAWKFNGTDTTGNGMKTEIFVDADAEVVTISITKTYVAEVTKVKDNGDDYTVTLSYKGSGVPADNTYEVEYTDLKKDDIVLVTANKEGTDDIQTVEKAKVVEGKITTVKKDDYIKMDGTTYNMNVNYVLDLDDSSTPNVKNPTVGDNATIYLDAFGNLIAFKNVESDSDYLYVKGIDSKYGDVSIKAVFADGTEKIVEIDQVDSDDADTSNTTEKKIYKYTTNGDKFDLTSLNPGTDEDQTVVLGASDDIKKDSANLNGKTVNDDTIFVDVKNNKTYTGYKNVPSMDVNEGVAVYGEGSVLKVVFVTDADISGEEDSGNYFFVKDNDAYTVSKDGNDKLYTWTAYVKGDETEIVATKDFKNTGDIVAGPGLYEIKAKNADGQVTKVEAVTGLDVDMSNGASHAATTAKGGVLKVTSDSDKSGSSKTTFTYSDKTVFMVVDMKDSGTKVDSVYAGSASDIETTGNNKSGVYVIAVDDKTDATPLATLVLVINK